MKITLLSLYGVCVCVCVCGYRPSILCGIPLVTKKTSARRACHVGYKRFIKAGGTNCVKFPV